MSSQAVSRRRKKRDKSPSAYSSRKRKKKRNGRSKQHHKEEEEESDTFDVIEPIVNNKRKKALNASIRPYFMPIHILMILGGIALLIVFSGSIFWMEYSKRLERQFQIRKYDHEAEMTRIALERARIDAEIEKVQQGLKEIQYNTEMIQTKQSHEVEMESMKLKHKKEVEKLRIESEREGEDFTLKMQKMKSLLAESDKKLQMELEQKEMTLRHETERIKLEYSNKLEEATRINDNQRILNELKITKKSELYDKGLEKLNEQIAKEKEALDVKRKECFLAKTDARDSWWINSGKYSDHATDICHDYVEYRNDVNKLMEHLSALTQQKTKLIEDGSSDTESRSTRE